MPRKGNGGPWLGTGCSASGAAVPRAVSPWRGVVRGGGGADRPGLGGRALAGAWGQRKMSALLEQKEQQERLREAAALGDIREVQKLVESGVDVNSQNEVNGW